MWVQFPPSTLYYNGFIKEFIKENISLENLINQIFTLIFEEKEIDYSTPKCNLGVINPTDTSNKNYGKD